MNITVEQIYPEPNSHQTIPHPETGRTVPLMAPRQFVRTAGKMLEAIVFSGRSTVIVLESGAAPLANTCKLLADKQGLSFAWLGLKVWREDSNAYWLSKEQASFDKCLILDEYVDSGTVMQKAFARIKKLGLKSSPGIICCIWLAEESPLEQSLKYASYRGRDNLYWENQGAYPCENRLDLIGYFFPRTKAQSGPCRIKDFCALVSPKAQRNSCCFLKKLSNYCIKKDILALLQKKSLLQPVRASLRLSHALRLMLAELEKAIAHSSDSIEFLDQLEDMYGPMWSPYPDSYHLDFQQASRSVAPRLKQTKNFSMVLKNYREIREPLLHLIAECCEARRLRWENKILQTVEEEKWSI